jgi:hypothetical protein
VAAQWLSPVLIVLSLGLLARAFFILYVRGRGSRASKVIAWLAAAFVAAFWTWQLLGGTWTSCGT